MIDKLYSQQWIILIIGIVFLIISIYTLFHDIKRDKVIAISIFLGCLVFYIIGEIRIKSHNAKAHIYFGTHELSNYRNSASYKLEVLPDNTYLIFDNRDTLEKGQWELLVSDKKTTLFLDGKMFGIGEYKIVHRQHQ